MIVVDTNVVSELLHPTPEPRVEGWLAAQDGFNIYLTALSEAELRYGVAIIGNGTRRKALATAIDRILREDLAGRILPFDSEAAVKDVAIFGVCSTSRGGSLSSITGDCEVGLKVGKLRLDRTPDGHLRPHRNLHHLRQ